MIDKIINLGIYLIVFALPFYLVQFRVFWIPITLLELIIYALFIIWLINQFKKKTFRSLKPILLMPIFLIVFGLIISTLFSADLKVSAGIFKGWFIAPLLFFVVLINTLRDKKQIKNLFLALFFSGLGVSLIALFYWLTNQLTYDGRLRAFYLSPNYLAMYLSPILILSFYLFFVFKNKVVRILLIIGYGLLFLTIYLTHSYGAWFGLLLALIFLGIGFLRNKSRTKLYLATFSLVLIIISSFWLIPSQKFQGLVDFSYPSLKSRLVIWQSAWEILKDHPLIGIGPGMFQKYYLTYQAQLSPYPEWAVPQPHNLFLAFWLQTGLLGLIGLIWLLITFFIKVFKHKLVNFFLASTMIYILAHGLIDTTYWKNDLAVIFWLVIALGYTSNRFSD